MHKAYRWHHYFESIDNLTCPEGHPLPAIDVWSDDKDLVCDHRSARGAAPCGRMVWVVGIERRLRSKSVLYVIEISSQELQHLKTAGLSWDDQLVYLGLLTKRKSAA